MACDSFHGTNLHEVLQERGIRHLVITGAQTEYCIETASRRAATLGYDVTLVTDGHTTSDTPVLAPRARMPIPLDGGREGAAWFLGERGQYGGSVRILIEADGHYAVLPTVGAEFVPIRWGPFEPEAWFFARDLDRDGRTEYVLGIPESGVYVYWQESSAGFILKDKLRGPTWEEQPDGQIWWTVAGPRHYLWQGGGFVEQP